MKRIYLDYASLTPIDPRVTSEMKKYASFEYGNPSSLYKEGVAAKKVLADGRQKVADYLNSHPDEIVFTSGGTEANNLAIEGVVRAFVKAEKERSKEGNIERPHIIISSIEHSSIIETVNRLEKFGCDGIKCEVTKLSVNQAGVISLDELKKSIKLNTVLVSIMMVNNEIGSIQPIKEIAKIIRQICRNRIGPTSDRSDLYKQYPLLHTDAAQALYEEINMNNLGVDLITLDGSKVCGPRGVGALYVKRTVTDNGLIEPIIVGGGQEKGLRSGTENLPSIMGFAKALELVKKERDFSQLKTSDLRDMLRDGLKKISSDIIINGQESPHILNISIPDIDNEFFLFQLDAEGIACSTKSSCLRDADESYVLKSIGADSKTSLRFSFGRFTKKGDIKKVLKIISRLLSKTLA